MIDLKAEVNSRNSEGLLPVDLALDNRNSLNKAKTASLLMKNGSYRGRDEDFFYGLCSF